MFVFFFFQAEDGIRDVAVTGVQTCALPISPFEEAVPDSGGPYRHFLGLHTLAARFAGNADWRASRNLYWPSVVVPYCARVPKMEPVNIFQHRVEIRIGESEYQQKTQLRVCIRGHRPPVFVHECVTFSP